MLKNFWFKIYGTPFLIGLLSLVLLDLNKLLNKSPLIKEALEICKNEDNNFVFSDLGTAQDICIDNFMHDSWMGELLLIFFGTIGMFFFIPLSIYFILKLIRG